MCRKLWIGDFNPGAGRQRRPRALFRRGRCTDRRRDEQRPRLDPTGNRTLALGSALGTPSTAARRTERRPGQETVEAAETAGISPRTDVPEPVEGPRDLGPPEGGGGTGPRFEAPDVVGDLGPALMGCTVEPAAPRGALQLTAGRTATEQSTTTARGADVTRPSPSAEWAAAALRRKPQPPGGEGRRHERRGTQGPAGDAP